MANASRRGFLAAFAAFTGAGTGTAVALAPTVLDTTPDPDAELIAAGERLTRGVAFRDEAERRAEVAADAEQAEVGACPPELFIYDEAGEWAIDRRLFDFRNFGVRRVSRFRWEVWPFGEEGSRNQVWTGPDIRHAIAVAPRVLGRAGRTPFVIRDLRRLLPIAEVRDAAWERARRRHGASELCSAARQARTAVVDEVKRIMEMPAAGLAGITVKARMAAWWMADLAKDRPGTQHPPEVLMAVLNAVLAVQPGKEA